jgi:hypothetical protein
MAWLCFREIGIGEKERRRRGIRGCRRRVSLVLWNVRESVGGWRVCAGDRGRGSLEVGDESDPWSPPVSERKE